MTQTRSAPAVPAELAALRDLLDAIIEVEQQTRSTNMDRKTAFAYLSGALEALDVSRPDMVRSAAESIRRWDQQLNYQREEHP